MSASIIPLNAALADAGMASHLGGMTGTPTLRAIRDKEQGAQETPQVAVDLTPVRKKLYQQAFDAARPVASTIGEAARIAFKATAALMAWIIRMVAGLARTLGCALERSTGRPAQQPDQAAPKSNGDSLDKATVSQHPGSSIAELASQTPTGPVDAAGGDDDDAPRHTVGAQTGRPSPFSALAARTAAREAAGAAGDVATHVEAAASQLADQLVSNGSVAAVTSAVVSRGLGRVAPAMDEAELMSLAAEDLDAPELQEAALALAELPVAQASVPQGIIDASLLGVIAGENVQELCDNLLETTRRRCLAELEIHEVLRGVTSAVGVPLDRLTWSELVEEIGGERGRSALEAAQISLEKVEAAMRSRGEASTKEADLLSSLHSLNVTLNSGELPNEQADSLRMVLQQLSQKIAEINSEVLGEAVAVVPAPSHSVESVQAAVAQASEELAKAQDQVQSQAQAQVDGDDADAAPMPADNAFARLVQRGG